MNERAQLPKQAPLEVARRIHQTCKHFESAWRGATRPQLVAFLAEVSEPERCWLLAELLALEIELRQAAGEQPSEEKYRLVFPREDDWLIIANAFQRCASEARNRAALEFCAPANSSPPMNSFGRIPLCFQNVSRALRNLANSIGPIRPTRLIWKAR